jgi:catechol 2,3-dioxygenase-like lactoylglutathione lyase family enzyme
MTLNGLPVHPQVAVSDIARAAEFYEGKLGLSPAEPVREHGRSYRCGGGTWLHVYASPDHAGKATATVARFDVDDIGKVVAALTANGVTFEQYTEPVPTDERGIHDSGYGKVAWFKDPDGNTFALEQA